MNNCSLISNGGNFYGYFFFRQNLGTFTLKDCYIDLILFSRSGIYYAPFPFLNFFYQFLFYNILNI
jgi:hypothetical protein